MMLMAATWKGVLTTKASDWEIPADLTATFAMDIATLTAAVAAETANNSPSTREAAQLARKTVEERMRFLKSHYFLMPPLEPVDYSALLLKVPGSNKPTPIPRAVNTAAVSKPTSKGAHILRVTLSILDDLPEGADKNWYNYKIYYGIVDPVLAGADKKGAGSYISAPPAIGADLPHSVATARSTYTFDFPQTDRGKQVWFCAVLENRKHQEGPWGPLFSDMVP
jgi:hypothetical protein